MKNASEIAYCIASMENDFDLFEGIVRSWLTADLPPPGKASRDQTFGSFSRVLDSLERRVGIKLKHRDEFEEYLKSDKQEDWQRIFTAALPGIRKEVLDVVTAALLALPEPSWLNLLPPPFTAQVQSLLRSGHYLSAVRQGCDAVRALMREKTGFHDLDATELVNKAYGKDGQFKLAAWEGHSLDSVWRGYADMLRGAMTGIRNAHYHGTDEIDEAEASRLLVILGTLWLRVEGTTKVG
jgi:uncharacterized protein (TIGR02391 family)